MGIKSLTQLIKLKSNNAIEHIPLSKLSGKRVAIDASLIMYQSLINIPTEYNGKDTGHIIGVYNKNINYLSNNITPIFIFDGHPPK